MNSATRLRGAATADTIKSAKHKATSKGFRSRVADCVYSVITSEAFPNMPPNTTIQYRAISVASSQFDGIVSPLSGDVAASGVAFSPIAFATNLNAVAVSRCEMFADSGGCVRDASNDGPLFGCAADTVASDRSEAASTIVAVDVTDIGLDLVAFDGTAGHTDE